MGKALQKSQNLCPITKFYKVFKNFLIMGLFNTFKGHLLFTVPNNSKLNKPTQKYDLDFKKSCLQAKDSWPMCVSKSASFSLQNMLSNQYMRSTPLNSEVQEFHKIIWGFSQIWSISVAWPPIF